MRDGTAAEIVDLALQPKPELVIHAGNLPATTEALRDLLASSGKFFDRGLPVRIIRSADGGAPSAMPLTKHNVVIEAHRLCRPIKVRFDGERVPLTLPDRVSQMYLDMSGEWELPPLAGVTTAPLLSADGGVRSVDGYDPATALWCSSIPTLKLPLRPSRTDAEAALRVLRQAFRTFPFGDAPRCWDNSLELEVIDITKPPGRDESGFPRRSPHRCVSSEPMARAGNAHNGAGCVWGRHRQGAACSRNLRGRIRHPPSRVHHRW